MKSIGKYAFFGCTALEAFAQEHGYAFVLFRCLHGETTPATVPATAVPDGVTAIGSRAYAQCDALCLAVIPPSVVSIAADAFEGSAAQAYAIERKMMYILQ